MAVSISKIFDIKGRVIAPSPQGLSLDLLAFSKHNLMPANTVLEFSSASDVLNYFQDPVSIEYTMAQVYFKGFDGTVKTPSKLLISAWQSVNSPGIIISQNVPSLETLKTQGTASAKVTATKIDGSAANTVISIDLATIISLSGLSDAIAAAINAETGETSVTGSYNALSNKMILQTVGTGSQSYIKEFVSPDAGSDLGAILGFDKPSVISNGGDVQTPAENVAKAINLVSNFVSMIPFFSMPDADTVSAVTFLNTLDEDFCWFANTRNAAALSAGDTSALAYLVKDLKNVYVQYGSLANTVFSASVGACIDFVNGTILNWSFKSQAGLLADVTTDAAFTALLANGYNFYGTYGSKATTDTFLYNGYVTGIYNYIDALYSSMWLKDSMKQALVTLFTNTPSVTYTPQGYSLIKASLQSSINTALENNVIGIDVQLSDSQKIQITQELGEDVSSSLESNGYLIIVDDPGATARSNRQSPICKLYYTYAGAINKIVLESVQVQ